MAPGARTGPGRNPNDKGVTQKTVPPETEYSSPALDGKATSDDTSHLSEEGEPSLTIGLLGSGKSISPKTTVMTSLCIEGETCH